MYTTSTSTTDKTIPARPDIVFQIKVEKISCSINLAVPKNKYVQNTFAEKISKYSEFEIEIKRFRKQENVKIIPLIMSVTSLTPMTFTRHLE